MKGSSRIRVMGDPCCPARPPKPAGARIATARSIAAAVWIAAAILAVAAVVVPASADVTYIERSRVKEIGSPGAMEITRTVRISGQKEREESVTRYSLPLIAATGVRRIESDRIVRADRNFVWTLDAKSRSYSQSTMEDLQQRARAAAFAADSASMTTESADAKPVVEIEKTPDTRRIGPWTVKRSVMKVSTSVTDLASGRERNAMIVWELWMADTLPGAQEIHEFNRLYAQKTGTVSEFTPMAALAEDYTKSVGEAMLALKRIPGYPVEWTWTLRTDLSPEAAAALKDDAATQQESASEQSAENDNEIDNIQIDPAHQMASRSLRTEQEKNLRRAMEPKSGEDAETVSADLGPGVEGGMMVLMKATSTLESADTKAIDPASFEVPAGYRSAAARGSSR